MSITGKRRNRDGVYIHQLQVRVTDETLAEIRAWQTASGGLTMGELMRDVVAAGLAARRSATRGKQ